MRTITIAVLLWTAMSISSAHAESAEMKRYITNDRMNAEGMQKALAMAQKYSEEELNAMWEKVTKNVPVCARILGDKAERTGKNQRTDKTCAERIDAWMLESWFIAEARCLKAKKYCPAPEA